MDQDQRESLLNTFDKLSPVDQAAVQGFAEFLLSRAPDAVAVSPGAAAEVAPAEIPEPVELPRPDDERVVAAVKRLSKSYFMLDKKKMLGVTSDLVTQHVVQGREARDVIEELERLFADAYRQLGQDDTP